MYTPEPEQSLGNPPPYHNSGERTPHSHQLHSSPIHAATNNTKHHYQLLGYFCAMKMLSCHIKYPKYNYVQ